jgi:hypothetical protein
MANRLMHPWRWWRWIGRKKAEKAPSSVYGFNNEETKQPRQQNFVPSFLCCSISEHQRRRARLGHFQHFNLADVEAG